VNFVEQDDDPAKELNLAGLVSFCKINLAVRVNFVEQEKASYSTE
jgi:hypothetical protein